MAYLGWPVDSVWDLVTTANIRVNIINDLHGL